MLIIRKFKFNKCIILRVISAFLITRSNGTKHDILFFRLDTPTILWRISRLRKRRELSREIYDGIDNDVGEYTCKYFNKQTTSMLQLMDAEMQRVSESNTTKKPIFKIIDNLEL